MSKVLLPLITLTILIYGCGPTEIEGASEDPFIGGNDGLVVTFKQGAPPPEVLDESSYQFTVEANIRNVGEATVPLGRAHARLRGILASDFNVGSLTAPITEEIPGATKNFDGGLVPGGETDIAVPDDAAAFSFSRKIEGSLELPFTLELCYEYKTKVSTQYCLTSDVTEPGLCNPNGERRVFSSGAPVRMKSVRQSIAGTDASLLTFEVELKKGEVFLPEGAGADGCQRLFEKENHVEVTVDPVTSASMNCRGFIDNPSSTPPVTGILRLGDGVGTFTCTLDTTSLKADAPREMQVTIKYDHLTTAEKLVTVRHLLG